VPPPDSLSFRQALARLPTGVTVVTALGSEGPMGATANAVTSLSLQPPLMLAALDRRSRTLATLERAGRFGINVLASDQEALAHRFATKDPAHEKWHTVGWAEREGAPQIEGVALWLGCEVEDVHDGGDHAIVTGQVLDVETGPGEALVFHGGEYRGLSLP
jgi:flavin reductase (DIM6/NTAB) family NADH-FMN oxidoreductase RutF